MTQVSTVSDDPAISFERAIAPYREAAEMMGSPLGTVTSRLHRARRRLRISLTRDHQGRQSATLPAGARQ